MNQINNTCFNGAIASVHSDLETIVDPDNYPKLIKISDLFRRYTGNLLLLLTLKSKLKKALSYEGIALIDAKGQYILNYFERLASSGFR